METHPQSASDSAPGANNVSEVHNPSVDEGAARQGACAQVHLPTGAMCIMRHGHEESCEFSPAGQVDSLLAERKAAEDW
ncbi:hypothetical protein [Terrabacter sp. 2RAF25]|uniref:hypothetical protein n=1 Tax=Terrabacter sp. 2RAF25 TaxID=3232998 RepID=UPI003F9B0264